MKKSIYDKGKPWHLQRTLCKYYSHTDMKCKNDRCVDFKKECVNYEKCTHKINKNDKVAVMADNYNKEYSKLFVKKVEMYKSIFPQSEFENTLIDANYKDFAKYLVFLYLKCETLKKEHFISKSEYINWKNVVSKLRENFCRALFYNVKSISSEDSKESQKQVRLAYAECLKYLGGSVLKLESYERILLFYSGEIDVRAIQNCNTADEAMSTSKIKFFKSFNQGLAIQYLENTVKNMTFSD